MKIILYNRNLFELGKINFINEKEIKDKISLFKEANFYINQTACLIDRTEANEFFIPIKTLKIPYDKDNINKSFKQLCLERAEQLILKGKRINIMWSGGIDSTLALFCLMNKVNDKSQLRVILSPDSIAESGNMFDKLIKNKVDFILEPKVVRRCLFYKEEYENFNFNNEIITSGSGSDPLNTIMRLTIPYEEKLWHLGYENVLMQFTNKNVIDFLNKSIKAFPKKIKTYIEFLKFYHLNYNWQRENYFNFVNLDSRYFKCYDNFFQTDDFQKWSIWNEESNISTNIIKKPQKDLIYELTNDKLYSYGKNKGMSFLGAQNNNDWVYLMENGTTINYSTYKNENSILQ
jgi:hypothetical protein